MKTEDRSHVTAFSSREAPMFLSLCFKNTNSLLQSLLD